MSHGAQSELHAGLHIRTKPETRQKRSNREDWVFMGRGIGLVGSRIVAKLEKPRPDAVTASPHTGVNTPTGKELAGTLKGADVVVDVSNTPSFEAETVC